MPRTTAGTDSVPKYEYIQPEKRTEPEVSLINVSFRTLISWRSVCVTFHTIRNLFHDRELNVCWQTLISILHKPIINHKYMNNHSAVHICEYVWTTHL